jgi:hypothetical protein
MIYTIILRLLVYKCRLNYIIVSLYTSQLRILLRWVIHLKMTKLKVETCHHNV